MEKKEMTVGTERYVEQSDVLKEKEIVGEIKFITEQTRKMLLMSSIEIGRRLTEAKKFVKHGEWEAWLKERVNFSQRTANVHMQIFSEYGELAENSQSIANLNYTQAMKLLAVPSEEREQFIEENNVKDMTIKELQAKIKELKSEKSVIQRQLGQYEKKFEKYEAKESELKKTAEILKANIKELEEKAKEAENQKETEIKSKLEALVSAEKEKLKKAEEEAEKLNAEIANLKQSQSELIKEAKEEEKLKAQKEFAKKEAELQKEKAVLQSQLQKASQEAEKNKESADIAKCTLLIEDILNKYKTVMDIIQEYQKVNPQNANDILESFSKSLNITENQSKIRLAS